MCVHEKRMGGRLFSTARKNQASKPLKVLCNDPRMQLVFDYELKWT